MCYESAIEKQRNSYYQLKNGDSKFPKPLTETQIEKDAILHYTQKIFYKVQKEIKASCYHMSLVDLVVVDGMKKCLIRDKYVKDKLFQVCKLLSALIVVC